MIIFALLPLLLLSERLPLLGSKYVFTVSGIKVYVKNSDLINAFILGKDKLVITSKILEIAPNEIRAVLAHELAHMELRHYLINRVLLVVTVTGGTILGILNQFPLLVIFLMSSLLIQRYVQRKLELQADKLASKVVGVNEMRSLLLRYGDKSSNIFSTHPSVVARVSNLSS
jgi:Zn-dependent protease with chaperone function